MARVILAKVTLLLAAYAANAQDRTKSTALRSNSVAGTVYLEKTGICNGNVTLVYDGVEGWEVDHASDSRITDLESFQENCVTVNGTLAIDARLGTGDGEPSAAPLGAEVGIPMLNALRTVGNLHLTGAFHNLRGLELVENIEGDMSIKGTNELVVLKGIAGLKRIGGNLLIEENSVLEEVSGFPKLEIVGGFVRIRLNKELLRIAGLNALVSVGEIKVEKNILLSEIRAFEAVTVVAGHPVKEMNRFIKPGHLNCIVGRSEIADTDVLVSLE